ncbi:protease inhibitor I42 family protein [Zobellia nedashkovskayae]|uniref:protease inhibitor I42 family protein n=1 Tax=Zobellia nedashkovskayae TaxID=2779510 RepID=UPI00188D72A1|nr:protease inhibitor I42 family protein [Zobellia nedashkovskayae]
MLKRNAILVFSILLLTVSCSSPLTNKDSGSTIELSENDVFTIDLQGEDSPEYEWRIVSENNHIKLAEPVTAETSGKNTESTFNFKTVGTGEDMLKIDYTNGTETKKTFKLRVIVGTMGRIEAY